ncbi:hypothetical protein PR202_gb03064 [Eleusine coracana subsp. coracana]|uniref:Splicing factor subunit n=1 Tax=Eleusine coracana subsp. coracana TaxID=191504 RepID=A0AAV5DYI4_ELECO|nr:hypothetical protein PR202_gb03064 [Eleusine coracana subsp. coracana]
MYESGGSDLKAETPEMPTAHEASDRFNINSQLEHLQAKYVGTGHADLTRFEWAVNIQRDSYASYIGHYPMLAYFSIAENESIGRERYNFMQDALQNESGGFCLSAVKCFFLVASLLREMKTEQLVHNFTTITNYGDLWFASEVARLGLSP